MKKKLKVTLVVFLVVVLGCFSQVFAATNQNNKAKKIAEVKRSVRLLNSATIDDGVIGTSNLNGTAENSAKFGNQLTAPEVGWKRYDGNSVNIKFSPEYSKWSTCDNDSTNYGMSPKYTNDTNAVILFKFYGTKLRIMQRTYSDDRTANISIDKDISEKYLDLNNGHSMLVYEKSGLQLGVHTVTITWDNDKSGSNAPDAIDIDSTGYLIDPSVTLATGITLSKTTDSLILNDAIKGKDTLTATVTPDNATNKTVKWTSSNSDIVSVDDNGNIIAGSKVGTATITATIDGTNLSASCTVTVTEPTNPTDNSDKAVLNITMTNGQVKQYNVTMDTVNKFIAWYRLRSAGSGNPFYEFDVTQTSSPTIIKTDYVVFDKISSFEVDDYTK